jgi:hypothetical protein
LNEDLPLCVRGEIITPNWLLPDAEKGGAWLDSAPQRHLRDLRRDKVSPVTVSEGPVPES